MNYTAAKVNISCREPPISTYLLIWENFSKENSIPMVNSKKITPNSARTFTSSMGTSPSPWGPASNPVIKKAKIAGTLILRNNNSAKTDNPIIITASVNKGVVIRLLLIYYEGVYPFFWWLKKLSNPFITKILVFKLVLIV
jgi:hypothetical protein